MKTSADLSDESTSTSSAAPGEPGTAEQRMPLRRVIGIFLGPALGLATFLLTSSTAEALSPTACSVAGVTVLMAVWWMTEAVPFAATALLPLALFPVLGVAELDTVAAPYASDVVFLFLGGFVLALTMQKWGLHRRIALAVVLAVGTRPTRLIGGFMLATALISMWVSSTATAMMMLPMGLSIVTLLRRNGEDIDRNFAICLMLGIAYGATMSTTTTIVATPGNAFVVAYLAQNHGIEITFAEWMLVGTPLSLVFLTIAWFLLTRMIFPPRIDEIPGGAALIRQQLQELGPLGRGERFIAVVFVGTALCWIFIPLLSDWPPAANLLPWLGNVSEAGIAVIAAIVCFLLPVRPRRDQMLMRWEDASDVPWGILLMFGGGLSMSAMITQSGLSDWLGSHVAGLRGVPPILLVILVAGLVLFLTELTSTTATIATYVPVMGGIAAGLGQEPMTLVLTTVFASGFAFMLPIATPPNAIAIGSGYVTIGQMVRGGLWLNLAAMMLVPITMYTLAAWVFELGF
ncbi:SLC13 family permease [Bounagaea algeriensis]